MMQDQNQHKSKKGMPKLLVLSIALYAFLLLIVLLRINNSRGPFPEKSPETIEVATMKSSLPAMTLITCDHIYKEMVSRDELPEGRLVSPEDITYRILAVPVDQGQVLTESCFISKGNVKLNPNGMRAITVPVSRKVIPDGALLYPGCVVDVLVAYKLSSRTAGKTSLPITMLRKIQVLAISGDGKLVILMVDPKQAEALQLAVENGQISLSIRNPNDDYRRTMLERPATHNLYTTSASVPVRMNFYKGIKQQSSKFPKIKGGK